MKKILVLIVSFLSLIACNMKERKFSSEYYPQVYFSDIELPIAKAIWDGNGEELKRLIKQRKVNINQPGKEGYTYLQYAADIMKYDMMQILLENGANPNIISPRTYVPGAGKQSKPETIVCLESVCYNQYDLKYLKLLLRFGANINDTRAGAPLSQAIIGYQQDKINFLLKNGADVNIVADWGLPPIIVAADLRRWELVEQFLDAGADPFLEVEGSSLKRSIEYYINSSEGTPAYRKKIRALMKRLQKQGMEFDFSKAKIKMED